jgi:hypothetical protein
MPRHCLVLSWLVALVLLIIPTAAFTQSLTFGIPPFSSVDGGVDSINLSNLGFVYNFPIFSRAGRGTPFSVNSTFQNQNWSWGIDINGHKVWFLTLTPPFASNPAGYVFMSTGSVACQLPVAARQLITPQ